MSWRLVWEAYKHTQMSNDGHWLSLSKRYPQTLEVLNLYVFGELFPAASERAY